MKTPRAGTRGKTNKQEGVYTMDELIPLTEREGAQAVGKLPGAVHQ